MGCDAGYPNVQEDFANSRPSGRCTLVPINVSRRFLPLLRMAYESNRTPTHILAEGGHAHVGHMNLVVDHVYVLPTCVDLNLFQDEPVKRWDCYLTSRNHTGEVSLDEDRVYTLACGTSQRRNCVTSYSMRSESEELERARRPRIISVLARSEPACCALPLNEPRSSVQNPRTLQLMRYHRYIISSVPSFEW